MDKPESICLKQENLPELCSAFEDYLEMNHKQEQDSVYPIVIHLADFFTLMPKELEIMDSFLDAHVEFHNTLTQFIGAWSGCKRDIYYSLERPSMDGDTAHIPFSPFDYINHIKENKLLRLRGTVESYSDFMSVPIMYKFECPSCGNKMQHKILKYLPCGCGRKRVKFKTRILASRCYFTLLEKMLDKKMLGSAPSVVQCYYEIQDIIPDKPLFDKNLVGKEVDVLCVVRAVDVIRNQKDEVHWRLQVRGLKLFDDGKISDDREKEIIETIRATNDPMKTLYNLATSMRDGVAFQDDYSVVCLIASVGVNADDEELKNMNSAINIVLVGDPSEGKTFVARQVLNYIPNGHFHVGRQNEKALLGATPAVSGMGDKNFVVKVGLFKIADNGFIIFDELDKLQKFSPQVMASIYTAMGDGHHTVDTAFAKLYFQYRTNVIALANYKNITADKNLQSKYAQIDIESGILRRMDAVIIYKNPYEDEHGGIIESKYKHFLAIQSGRVATEKIYSENFCKDYGIAVTQYNQAPFTRECLLRIEELTTNRRAQIRNLTDEGAIENLSKKPVDNRYPNTLKRWAKTISRLLFAEKTEAIHAEIADAILDRVQFSELMRLGITSKVEMEIIAEQQKTIKHNRWERLDAVKRNFEKNKIYSDDEIIAQFEKGGYTNSEAERQFEYMCKIGEFLYRAGKYAYQ